jgi:hypothetical protein
MKQSTEQARQQLLSTFKDLLCVYMLQETLDIVKQCGIQAAYQFFRNNSESPKYSKALSGTYNTVQNNKLHRHS